MLIKVREIRVGTFEIEGNTLEECQEKYFKHPLDYEPYDIEDTTFEALEEND